MHADGTDLTVSERTDTDLEKSLTSQLDKGFQQFKNLQIVVERRKSRAYNNRITHKKLSKITNNYQGVVNNKKIKRVSITKSLGVIIDEKLNREAEIDNIIKKISRGIGKLKKVKPILMVGSLLTTSL